MKLCSVIIPAFNAEAYIGEAIRSVLAQTYPAVETIVVNDGSTDDTAGAVAPYVGRVTYLEQENAGPAAARNRALQHASGEYVALLDADDLWLPDRLGTVLELLEADHAVGFATTDVFLLRGSERSTQTYYRDLLARPFAHDDQLHRILEYNFIFGMTVVRAELFQKHGTFEETLRGTEDWDLWIRFLSAGERAGFIDRPLGYYRLHPTSLSGARTYEHTLPLFERALPAIAARGWRGFGQTYYRRGTEALATGDLRRARLFFRAAARDPDLSPPRRFKAAAAAATPALAAKALRRARADGPESCQS